MRDTTLTMESNNSDNSPGIKSDHTGIRWKDREIVGNLTKRQHAFSVLGFCVGCGNFFLFPTYCYENGGEKLIHFCSVKENYLTKRFFLKCR